MMGRAHAMSGAAIALATTAIGVGPLDARTTPVAVIAMYTIVVAGGALAPDLDSHSSTVVRSFGIFGKIGHEITNAISLLIYNITKTKYDGDKDDAHRTFFHTTAFAVLVGFLVSLISIIPGKTTIYDHEYANGQIGSIIAMWFFLHLGLAGLFDFALDARKKFGPYLVMLASFGLTVLISRFLPENETYGWLGIAAGGGMLIHLLGDFITKMGVPILWPLKISGKRWYSVALPSFMRIKAGGAMEKYVLFPAFSIIAVIAGMFCLPFMNPMLHQLLGK